MKCWEVAKMVGMRHADLMRNIAHYIEAMGQNPILDFDTFFVEKSYIAGTGKTYKLSGKLNNLKENGATWKIQAGIFALKEE